jgi:hypothetical protein
MQRMLPNSETETILPASLAPLSKKVSQSETEADDSEGRLPLLFSLRLCVLSVSAFIEIRIFQRRRRGR